MSEITLSLDILQITLPDGEVRSYPLDRTSGVTNIGRHANNDIVLDSPNIKPFHFVLDHQQQPFQLIALREVESESDESQLVLEKIGELPYRESFEVAGHLLRLLNPESKKARSLVTEGAENVPQATPLPQPPPTTLSYDTNSFLTIQLSDDEATGTSEWIVKADENALYELIIVNPTYDDITCTISVVGLVASWVRVSPKTLLLQAGEQAKVVLSCLLPKQPSIRAGTHPLNVKVASIDNPEQVVQQKVVMRIQSFYAFSVAPLDPPQQALPFLRSYAKVTMKVTNRGNCEATFHITGFAVGSVCSFRILLPDATHSGQANLRLSARESLAFPVHIRPPTVSFFGRRKEIHHFALRTTMLTGRTRKEPTYYTVGGHLTSTPLINPARLVVLTLTFVLVVGFFFPQFVEQSYSWLLDTPAEELEELNNENMKDNIYTQEQEEWLFSETAVVATAEPSENVIAFNNSGGLITYEAMFQEIGAKHNLNWKLLASLAYRESTLNPKALGQDYDMGLMQIIPLTWNEIAPSLGVSDPYDPYSNALVGAAYLAQLRDYFAALGYNDVRMILVAYNWGPNNVEQVLKNGGGWDDFPLPTQQYALNILKIRNAPFPTEMDALLQKLLKVGP